MEVGRLEKHLSAKARQIHNAGNAYIADGGKIFVHSDAGGKGSLAQGDIAHMFHNAEGGIHCDNKGIRVVELDKLNGGLQIFGMDRLFQRAIEMEADFFQKSFIGF